MQRSLGRVPLDVATTANEAVDARTTVDSKVETKSCPDEDRRADEPCGTICAPIHEKNDGSGPTGTAADIFQQERTQYWALCPASQSVLLRMANTKGVNFMVFSTTRIQGHEAYQEVLQHNRRYNNEPCHRTTKRRSQRGVRENDENILTTQSLR